MIIRNQIRTPDGTILRSYNRHDYKQHTDRSNGELYMVDGGTEYLRRSVNKHPAHPMDVYSDAPFEVIREALAWGARGRYGDQPLHYILLSDMTSEHIQAVLDTQSQMDPFYREAFEKEIKYRNGHKTNKPEGCSCYDTP